MAVFPSFYDWVILLCVCDIFFIHSSRDGRLGCFMLIHCLPQSDLTEETGKSESGLKVLGPIAGSRWGRQVLTQKQKQESSRVQEAHGKTATKCKAQPPCEMRRRGQELFCRIFWNPQFCWAQHWAQSRASINGWLTILKSLFKPSLDSVLETTCITFNP